MIDDEQNGTCGIGTTVYRACKKGSACSVCLMKNQII